MKSVNTLHLLFLLVVVFSLISNSKLTQAQEIQLTDATFEGEETVESTVDDEDGDPLRAVAKKKTTEPTKRPTSKHPTSSPTGKPTTKQPTAQRRPSVLVLLADDMDYGDVGYYGGLALTPNIDALSSAQGTVRLDNFHSASAVCSPSRASIMSGRNPERDCIVGALSEDNIMDFRTDMPSVIRYAKKAGYKTGFFGKWHLGRNPIYAGFDYYIKSHASLPAYDPTCFCPERRCQVNCHSAKDDKCFKLKNGKCSSKLSPQCEMGHLRHTKEIGFQHWGCNMQTATVDDPNEVQVNIPRNVTASEFLAGYVVEHLRQVPEHQAFYFQVSFHEPHRPYFASEWVREDCHNGRTCRAPEIQRYASNSLVVNFYSVIGIMDKSIGTIINTLHELDRFDDTILIFTSDNGGESPSYGGVPKLSTRFLRGFKRSVYEGGTRVPALISWPNKIKSNFRVNEPTSMLDLFVTLTDMLLEFDPSLDDSEPTPRSDGISLLPLIDNPREWNRTKPFGVCMPITLLQKSICATYAYYEGRNKVIVQNNKVQKAQGYNTVDDMLEKVNVAKKIEDWKGLTERAREWRRGLFAEFSAYCKTMLTKKVLDKMG